MRTFENEFQLIQQALRINKQFGVVTDYTDTRFLNACRTLKETKKLHTQLEIGFYLRNDDSGVAITFKLWQFKHKENTVTSANAFKEAYQCYTIDEFLALNVIDIVHLYTRIMMEFSLL